MSTRDKLVQDVEAFLVRYDIAPSTFGVMALEDPSFVHRLRKGRDPGTIQLDRCREFMRTYKPIKKKRERRSESVAA